MGYDNFSACRVRLPNTRCTVWLNAARPGAAEPRALVAETLAAELALQDKLAAAGLADIA